MAKQPKHHYNFVAQLLKTEAYSDMKLQHPQETLQLHKAVVCPQSPVIAAAFKGGFQESSTGVLKVDSSFDLETVKRMISFFYTGKYSVETRKSVSTNNTPSNQEPHAAQRQKISPAKNTEDLDSILSQHLHVFEIADYYAVTKLKATTVRNIKALFDESWSEEVFLEFSTNYMKRAKDSALMEMCAKTAVAHLHELVDVDGFDKLLQNAPLMFKMLTHGTAEFKRLIGEFDDCMDGRWIEYDCDGCGHLHAGIRVKRAGFCTTFEFHCEECNKLHS